MKLEAEHFHMSCFFFSQRHGRPLVNVFLGTTPRGWQAICSEFSALIGVELWFRSVIWEGRSTD